MMLLKYLFPSVAVFCSFASWSFAQVVDDGATDHPLLTRYPGFQIEVSNATEFDQARLIASAMINGKASFFETAGQISNIKYSSNEGQLSAFQIIANYKRALDDLQADILLYCANASDCGGEGWQYELETRDLDLFFNGLDVFFSEKYGILVAKVEQDERTAHVMVVVTADVQSNKRNVYQSIVTGAALEVGKIGIGTVEDVTAQVDETGAVVLEGVLFDFDTAILTETSAETLDIATQFLKANPDQKFYVVGHTDGVGTYDYNVALSQNRAKSVLTALETRGVSTDRLTSVGVGPVAPVANNESEAGQALNRRVELVLRP